MKSPKTPTPPPPAPTPPPVQATGPEAKASRTEAIKRMAGGYNLAKTIKRPGLSFMPKGAKTTLGNDY